MGDNEHCLSMVFKCHSGAGTDPDNSRNFIGEMVQKMKIARIYVSALY